MKKEYLHIHNLITGEEEGGLSRFHLRMSRGDFVEMLGTDGAGKLAAASFFAGKEKIREGFVRIGGIRYYPGESIANAGIQYIGPIPSLASSLTVAENVALLTPKRRIRGLIRHRDLEMRVNFLLAEFGLSIRADQRIEDLTEGEKRCIELLRAAENEVPFVFFDHVFDSLGQADIQLVEECLSKLKSREVTILILGGGFPVFRGLDDRVVVLRGGRAVRTFYRGSFDREEYVKWVFGVTLPESVRSNAVIHLQNRGEFLSDQERDEEILRLSSLTGGTIRELSMSAKQGEIIGLYDMNNQKNREMIRILIGEIPIESGWMSLCGQPYTPSSLEDAIHSGICFIPGSILMNAVIENLSYGENLTLSTLRQHSLFGIFPKKRILQFLEREFRSEKAEETNLGVFGRHTSVGMVDNYEKMRIALHRALIARPAILLAEDIVSDMSVEMLKLENEYFSKLTKGGCTVLISSQNLAVLRQICDRILVMNSEQEIMDHRPPTYNS